jgi:hypothetical protein
VRPVVYQMVAVHRHCGAIEERFVKCMQRFGGDEELCEKQLSGLTHCVETIANPRAKQCLESNTPPKDI